MRVSSLSSLLLLLAGCSITVTKPDDTGPPDSGTTSSGKPTGTGTPVDTDTASDSGTTAGTGQSEASVGCVFPFEIPDLFQLDGSVSWDLKFKVSDTILPYEQVTVYAGVGSDESAAVDDVQLDEHGEGVLTVPAGSMALGENVLAVALVDGADTIVKLCRFKVSDLTPPAIEITTPADEATIIGETTVSGVVNEMYTPLDDLQITVVAGSVTVADILVAADGTWSTTITPDISPVMQQFEVTTEDAEGNIGAAESLFLAVEGVEIVSPRAGIRYLNDTPISFEADYSVATGGGIDTIAWVSDRGGLLSNEAAFEATLTQVGYHTITVSVTWLDGSEDEASLTINVEDPAYVDGDGDGLTPFEGDCDDTDYGVGDGDVYYPDVDGDGYGDERNPTTACVRPAGEVSDGTDCDDADPTVNPNAEERCDSVDNNCDRGVDIGAIDTLTWYPDADGDGYGDVNWSGTAACRGYYNEVSIGGDCDDSSTLFYPGAPETDCTDPNDYNCDGTTGYADDDGDGHVACQECDDDNAAVHPGAQELCSTEYDDDCDGETNEASATDAESIYADTDLDGYGDPAVVETRCLAVGDVTDSTDCDDTDIGVHPGAEETCDDVDEDCDGAVDDAAVDMTTWYADLDSDGYGNATSATLACDQPGGTVLDSQDCDDTEALATLTSVDETLTCDGVDNNCDGQVDERPRDVSEDNDTMETAESLGDAEGDWRPPGSRARTFGDVTLEEGDEDWYQWTGDDTLEGRSSTALEVMVTDVGGEFVVSLWEADAAGNFVEVETAEGELKADGLYDADLTYLGNENGVVEDEDGPVWYLRVVPSAAGWMCSTTGYTLTITY